MGFIELRRMPEIAINRFADCLLCKLSENKTLDKPMKEYDKPLGLICENYKNCPIDGNNGHWNGKRGDSHWYPDHDYIPGKANPEGKAWKQILDKYGIDYIPYKEGEPDFSEISKGSVEIISFSENRSDNFDKADIELAKKHGCDPAEVAQWRKENRYTWHECKDMRTMQKVPSEIHNSIPHSGGISEVKKGLVTSCIL